jgi:hypothetical protein
MAIERKFRAGVRIRSTPSAAVLMGRSLATGGIEVEWVRARLDGHCFVWMKEEDPTLQAALLRAEGMFSFFEHFFGNGPEVWVTIREIAASEDVSLSHRLRTVVSRNYPTDSSS